MLIVAQVKVKAALSVWLDSDIHLESEGNLLQITGSAVTLCVLAQNPDLVC